MSKVFWAACGLVFVAAIALWAAGTRAIRAEIDDLRKQQEREKRKLRELAGGKKKIVNRGFIEESRTYKQKLAEEKEALRATMRERNMDLSDEAFQELFGGAPPRTSVAEFRTWLEDRYHDRDKLLVKAAIRFHPGDPRARGDVEDWGAVRIEDFPEILRKFMYSYEIARALADAEAEVVYPPARRGGKPRSEKRKVVEFRSLSFETESPTGARTAGPISKGPYSEFPVSVTILAHHGVARDFIHRIETTKRGLFVARSFNMRRAGAPRRRQEEEVDERLANTGNREAPVEVEIDMGVLDFPMGGG
jgi:hypothetical protein